MSSLGCDDFWALRVGHILLGVQTAPSGRRGERMLSIITLAAIPRRSIIRPYSLNDILKLKKPSCF
jgi:hypothetical protein